MKYARLLLVMFMAVCVVGCASLKRDPIETQTMDVAASFKGMSRNDVEDSIIKACSEKGWKVDGKSNSVIDASITVRDKHVVAVRIPYTAKSVKIEYKSSTNMLYEEGNPPQIHGNYNRWVRNLLAQIRIKLTELSNTRMQ